MQHIVVEKHVEPAVERIDRTVVDLYVQRSERDSWVCRTQRLDDQVVDGDAAR